MSEDLWHQPCHRTIPWDEMTTFLIQRSRKGSWYWEIALAAGGGLSAELATLVVSTGIDRSKKTIFGDDEGPSDEWEEYLEHRVGEMTPEFRADLEALVPFFLESDFFVGERKHWISDEEAIGRNDRQAALYLLDFFQNINTQLSGESESERNEIQDDVDFSRNLVSIGGPISNGYIRNLLYGDEVDLPYRYNLNPSTTEADLGELTPAELKELGRVGSAPVSIDSGPNWYLADREGEPITVNNRRAIPVEDGDGSYRRDYFTIIKTRNVHPDAGPDSAILSLSGSHGLGTKAAVFAMQTPQIVDSIRAVAGDGPFQAVGTVFRAESGPNQIAVPQIEPLDQEV